MVLNLYNWTKLDQGAGEKNLEPLQHILPLGWGHKPEFPCLGDFDIVEEDRLLVLGV